MHAHQPLILEHICEIKLLTLTGILSLILIGVFTYVLVKVVISLWKPYRIIRKISIQSACIYGPMFILIFNKLNYFNFRREGLGRLRVIDVLEPLGLTFLLFSVSVIACYIALSKNGGYRIRK